MSSVFAVNYTPEFGDEKRKTSRKIPFYFKSDILEAEKSALAELTIVEMYARILQKAAPDFLSEGEIREASCEEQIWEVFDRDRAGRKSVFMSRPIEKTLQGLVVPLVEEAIRQDSQIGSVLEIGVYYAWVLNYLALRYPNLKFRGIDMPWSTVRINEEFSAKNLSVSIGYALRELEEKRISGDLVFSSSTFVRLRNAEFLRYLDAMKCNGTKWLVANEVMIPRQNGENIDPCLVDPEYSIPVMYENSAKGMPPCYIHNYREILTSKGFDILHYRVYAPLAAGEYRLETVARLNV